MESNDFKINNFCKLYLKENYKINKLNGGINNSVYLITTLKKKLS